MRICSRLKLASLFTLLGILCVGCTHYEFDLTRPVELATHIGTKTDAIVARDPLEYRLIAFEDHLVMRIYNATDDPIELLGSQSSIVDPKGQSHPVRSQSIASHSFIKLILPPLHPHLEPTGPSIGIGIGFIGDAGPHRSFRDPFDSYVVPRYFDVVVDDETLYWDWDGETEVRLLLSFQRVNQRFTQEFVFHRVKV